LATACWQTNKPLPAGVHVDSPWYPIAARDVAFIADITSADAYGRPNQSQAIFDQVLNVIRTARKFVVLDYYLFNAQVHSGGDFPNPSTRQISAELRDALIERRRADPGLQVLLITDPINEAYGAISSRDFGLLRASGVAVAITDLDRLRDSNYVYSSLWRLGVKWWTSSGRNIRPYGTADHVPAPEPGWFPNPVDESEMPVTFAAWTRLLNFKANQRKVVIADDGHDGLVAVVGSANPHDASSAHSNTALKLAGPAIWPLLQSELNIAHFSGWEGQIEAEIGTSQAGTPAGDAAPAADGRAKIITEGAILSELLEHIDATVRGDSIDIAMFYVSDRGVIEALLNASQRGVNVRLVLDPNKDAFGHARSGITNQPVASELVAASDGAIHVRWYRTHGEQFHTKLAMIYGPEKLWLTVGSANLTRRNLADYNLEADIAVEVPRGSPLASQTQAYFETLWSNRASLGIEYTADFGYYADPSQLHYWLYRVMEGTGVSTF
jgi:phosphatidylserine/phosphatidylglycerophosphate/cardiolipin synthase-like enzyme